jgi:hypothetical protein
VPLGNLVSNTFPSFLDLITFPSLDFVSNQVKLSNVDILGCVYPSFRFDARHHVGIMLMEFLSFCPIDCGMSTTSSGSNSM